jgi:hypothetical protein
VLQQVLHVAVYQDSHLLLVVATAQVCIAHQLSRPFFLCKVQVLTPLIAINSMWSQLIFINEWIINMYHMYTRFGYTSIWFNIIVDVPMPRWLFRCAPTSSLYTHCVIDLVSSINIQACYQMIVRHAQEVRNNVLLPMMEIMITNSICDGFRSIQILLWFWWMFVMPCRFADVTLCCWFR